MKHILLLSSLFFIFAQGSFAQQYGFTVYAENGEKFELFANNKRKTPQPATEVTVYGFRRDAVRLKVDFERSALADVSQQIIMREGFISRYKIISRGRRSTEMVFEGYEPFPAEDDDNTTSIVTIDNKNNYNQPDHQPYPRRNPYKELDKNTWHKPVSDADFSLILNNLEKLNFDSEKLERAKQISDNNLLTSAQVKQMLRTFDFDSKRLEFAKYAYENVYDKGMYFLVSEAFDFSSSGKQLDNYIAARK